MLWQKCESNTRPEEVTELKDGRVIATRNIVESTTADGGKKYDYEYKVMSELEYAVTAAVNEKESKRESEIVDEYTMKLIEEGVL